MQRLAVGTNMTLGELLLHPSPPVDLLLLVKQFAKLAHHSLASALPHELLSALYHASSVAAMVRSGRRISRLTNEAMRRGLIWACHQQLD